MKLMILNWKMLGLWSLLNYWKPLLSATVLTLTLSCGDSFADSVLREQLDPRALKFVGGTVTPPGVESFTFPTDRTIWVYDDTNQISADQARALSKANVFVVRNAKMVLHSVGKKQMFSERHPVVYRRWVTFRTEFAPILFGAGGVAMQSVTAAKVTK